MQQLDWPTLFCHKLEVENDRIINYRLRQANQKAKSVAAFKELNYYVIAAGDSFNDTGMLLEANVGFFFHAPVPIQQQFPQFKAVETYRRPDEINQKRNGKIVRQSPSGFSVLRLRVPRHQVVHAPFHVLAFVKHPVNLVNHRRHHPVFLRKLPRGTRRGITLRHRHHACQNIRHFFSLAQRARRNRDCGLASKNMSPSNHPARSIH